ncbi:hypothetical protein [Streptomyces harbinensis]|uniref:Uncharacterized protein n=1 Tax=Streptomyces harbinensis TaxID=1176198 RepID=A0A1I6W6T9_9ACTN|nr:hypothetical protein [Streptomyces harbinensis]SFT21304.1 hypothetical protein SAMN05444716_11324 [Streptomyces harbinensis]
MTAETITGLREVHALLKSLETQDIHRPDVVREAAKLIVARSLELVDVTEPEDAQQRLAFAVRDLKSAEKAARSHRRNPLARPLSRARFAFTTRSAEGWVGGVLEDLDGTTEGRGR